MTNTPFAHLTYKSAAVSIRSSSDLASQQPRVTSRRYPFANVQRSATTLATTTIPTDSTAGLPPRSTKHTKRLFRPIDDTPRRTRSLHKQSLTRSTSSAKQVSMLSNLPSRGGQQQGRTVYHSTTASAKAKQMVNGQWRDAELEHHLEQRGTNRAEFTTLQSNPRLIEQIEKSPPTTQSKKYPKIVVKRRLIRGTSVFRPATEAELEEFLNRERYREMVRCDQASVNVPPLRKNEQKLAFEQLLDNETDPSVQSVTPINPRQRAGLIGRRGVRRVSSLLGRYIGESSDENHRYLDLSELAAMDECTAVAVFLKEIRTFRRDVMVMMQEKAISDKDKDKKRRGGARDKRIGKREDVERVVRLMNERRSISADDPALMRALIRQEHLLAAQTRKRRIGPKPYADEMDNKKDSFHQHFELERSFSELALHVGVKNRHDSHRRRALSTLGRGDRRGAGHGRGRAAALSRGLNSGSIVEQTRSETIWPKSDSGTDKAATTETEDEEDVGGPDIRILTAIEPVDPTLGIDDDDARRGTSYHIGAGTTAATGNRRRVLVRGIPGGESGLLRRLRSLRRRTEERHN